MHRFFAEAAPIRYNSRVPSCTECCNRPRRSKYAKDDVRLPSTFVYTDTVPWMGAPTQAFLYNNPQHAVPKKMYKSIK